MLRELSQRKRTELASWKCPWWSCWPQTFRASCGASCHRVRRAIQCIFTPVLCEIQSSYYNYRFTYKPDLPSITSTGGPERSAHWQTYTDRTKACFLTFLSLLCLHLITVTMTFTCSRRRLTGCTCACSPSSGDGTWSRQDKTEKNKTKQKKKKPIHSSTSHRAREQTLNSHKLCFEYTTGRQIQWADRNKRNRGCTERWANVVLPRQPHLPVMMGRPTLPLSASSSTAGLTKKKKIMVEQVQSSCHPSLKRLLLQLSDCPYSNQHITASPSIQLPVVCVPHTQWATACTMYCYRLLYNCVTKIPCISFVKNVNRE